MKEKESTGAQSILEAEDERILEEMKAIINGMSDKKELDLKLDLEQIKSTIANGLNVEKELEKYQGQLLADQLAKEESEIISKIQLVKDTIKKICEEKMIGDTSDHKCLGVVSGTFIICGEDNYQYCSKECMDSANKKISCVDCPINDECPGFKFCPYMKKQ